MSPSVEGASSGSAGEPLSARDVELDAVLIGGREPVEVILSAPDPRWGSRFEDLAGVLRDRLAGVLIDVEHIGSTSVLGLAAKPIVDVLVLVPDPEDEDAFVPALEAAGFLLRVREPGHRMFRTAARDVHVHVYAPGVPEVDAYRRFREQLRASAEDRALYERVKRELAGRRWSDMNHYADAKTAVIEEILSRAPEVSSRSR